MGVSALIAVSVYPVILLVAGILVLLTTKPER